MFSCVELMKKVDEPFSASHLNVPRGQIISEVIFTRKASLTIENIMFSLSFLFFV